MTRDAGSVKAWVLAFVLAAGGLFGVLMGVGCVVNANVCPFRDDAPLATTDGREVFTARCAQCHGMNGEGANGPPLRSGRAAQFSPDELRRKIEKGRPFMGMPAFKFGSRPLTDAQIAAVTRYVLSLREAS